MFEICVGQGEASDVQIEEHESNLYYDANHLASPKDSLLRLVTVVRSASDWWTGSVLPANGCLLVPRDDVN